MKNKKISTKFSIQFNQHNPLHIRTAEILNGLKPRGKSRYIVDAILHYEGCEDKTDPVQLAMQNEQYIEAVVRRLLLDKKGDIPGVPQASAPPGQGGASTSPAQDAPDAMTIDDINFDDAVEALGEDGMKAISETMAWFRKE